LRSNKNKKYLRADGFRSGLEKTISKRLPKGTKFESEKIKYFIPKDYVPDFIIPTKSGKKIYLEVKGWMRYEDQQKMRAVKMCNPELDIRMYFPKDNKVQSSKLLNSEWCRKYGFPYAIEKIPRGWFK
jgi:hypothetical protein